MLPFLLAVLLSHTAPVQVVTLPSSGLGAVAMAELAPPCMLPGDWESPRELLVAFAPRWAADLAPLLRAVAPTPVRLLAAQGNLARRWLEAQPPLPHVSIMQMPLDSRWVRDYGPLQQRCHGHAWRWRDAPYVKHRPNDDAVPARLGATTPLRWPVQGGALIANGAGLCATTWATLAALGVDLRDKAVMAELLPDWGCHALVAVPALQHEASGHIDMMAQFIDATTVAVSQGEPNAADMDAAALDTVAESLRWTAAQMARPLKVVRVPQYIDAMGTYYSYVNAVAVAQGLIVPSYINVPEAIERAAHGALRNSAKRIMIVPADGLVHDGGAWHCATLGLFTWQPTI